MSRLYRSPKDVLKKITDVTQAWAGLRPDKSFVGQTLDQFKEVVKPSLDIRTRIADLEDQLREACTQREAADATSMASIQRLVHAVRADPDEGEDGALYAAMGFIRKSLRATGLTRRRPQEQPKEVKSLNGAG
jgi:hypothetical protein